METKCPYCHRTIVVRTGGRKPLGLPVTDICDALRLHHGVLAAANELGCSRAYIYKVLKAAGLTPADINEGRVK
jgi:AraC-like DNA-binding protein